MNFIEKFYIKQCATEVQIMLERMKQRPEDFDYGTGWRKLVELADSASSPYTPVERKMIRKYWKECQNTRNRNELLSRIMSETINPTKEDYTFNDKYSKALAASMQATKQTLASTIIPSTYTDARALYGNPLQNRHQP
jgi:hypothetical protein